MMKSPDYWEALLVSTSDWWDFYGVISWWLTSWPHGIPVGDIRWHPDWNWSLGMGTVGIASVFLLGFLEGDMCLSDKSLIVYIWVSFAAQFQNIILASFGLFKFPPEFSEGVIWLFHRLCWEMGMSSIIKYTRLQRPSGKCTHRLWY